MRIYGIGADIVKVNRIKKSIQNNLLIKRLFNKREIIRCKKIVNSANCFAKRFAAKEAFSKALGTGIAKGINFNEIIILNDKNGKPFIRLTDKTKKYVEKKLRRKKYTISLSLTDEDNYAAAFVTISL